MHLVKGLTLGSNCLQSHLSLFCQSFPVTSETFIVIWLVKCPFKNDKYWWVSSLLMGLGVEGFKIVLCPVLLTYLHTQTHTQWMSSCFPSHWGREDTDLADQLHHLLLHRGSPLSVFISPLSLSHCVLVPPGSARYPHCLQKISTLLVIQSLTSLTEKLDFCFLSHLFGFCLRLNYG